MLLRNNTRHVMTRLFSRLFKILTSHMRFFMLISYKSKILAYQWKMSFTPTLNKQAPNLNKQATEVILCRNTKSPKYPTIYFNNSPLASLQFIKHLCRYTKIYKANRGYGVIKRFRYNFDR